MGNQYRQGIIFSIQKGDFDAAISMLQGMGMVLPEVYRPKFAPVPIADNLQADLVLKQLKWTWVNDSLKATEDAISRWIHDNFDKVAMGV